MNTTKWVLDPNHSEIQFKVKYLRITTVTGYFREFNATAESDDANFSNTKVSFEAKTASVDTNNADRDNHLRKADFFESDKYPVLKFESKEMKSAGDEKFKLSGDLTIKDVSNPITLDVEFGGINKDPWGNEKAGFSLSGKINRKDWGLNWNTALETGGVLVSDEVRIFCEIQFVKQT
jgi:polyisoprenoid-binding protein YceI